MNYLRVASKILVVLTVGGVLLVSCSSSSKVKVSTPPHRANVSKTTRSSQAGANSSPTSATPVSSPTSTRPLAGGGLLSNSFLANPNCSGISSSLIGTALGESLSSPISSTGKNSLLCTYNVMSQESGQTTTIEFQSSISDSQFSNEQAQATKNNKITQVPGLGNGAFVLSVSVGTTSYSALYILDANTQISISSTSTPAKEESLAKTLIG